MMHITAHAISRYRERVAAVSEAEARKALSCEAIRKAVEFGASFVKLGTGHHVVLCKSRVVTVLVKGTSLKAFSSDAAARREDRRAHGA